MHVSTIFLHISLLFIYHLYSVSDIIYLCHLSSISGFISIYLSIYLYHLPVQLIYSLHTCLPADLGDYLPNHRYFVIHNTLERQEVRKPAHFLLGIPVHESCLFWLNSLRTYSPQESLGGSRTPSCLADLILGNDQPEKFLYVFSRLALHFLMTFLCPTPAECPP